MKKNRTLSRVVMGVSVASMGVGLASSFSPSAEGRSIGKKVIICYAYDDDDNVVQVGNFCEDGKNNCVPNPCNIDATSGGGA